MRPEMKYHMTCRWNGDKSISMTEDEWESYIDDTLISYVKKRPSFIKRLLKKTLIDEKECTLVVNIENGGSMITLNTVDISSWRVWVGTYFRSTDIPLEVETFAGHNIDELSVSSDDGSAYYKNGILYFKDSSMVTVNIKIS